MILFNNNDTIVALSSPKGIGAISLIRVSGSKAYSILNQIFLSKNLSIQKPNTLHVGFLQFQNEIIDEVVLCLYKNSKSFTGEDVIEINCHGSIYIQNRIIEILLLLGCRLARPGEFTLRAFLNGKIDLTQAEAVADLIDSNTEASKNTAIRNIKGGFKSDLTSLRQRLLHISAMIELELDFATEDVEFIDRSNFLTLIDDLIISNTNLLNSFKLGNVIKNGVQVAIIGKPNTGKSTLLNKLLNENRAIVSDIAGTTRDTIEEVLNINGVLFRLIDTAGIRDKSVDVIENIGIDKSIEKMTTSDFIISLFDFSNSTKEDIINSINYYSELHIRTLLVVNKMDIIDTYLFEELSSIPNILFISAKNNINIDLLKEKLYTLAVGTDVYSESTIITNLRHYDALKNLAIALAEIKGGLINSLSGDLLSLEIKQALYYLGLITGEITNKEQLDLIFSKFCIGK